MLTQYDYIIAGGGAAGLSLAYYMSLSTELKNKKILIVDQAKKDKNDRTWCFWEQGTGTFENIVQHSWDKLYFYGQDFERLLNIAPYRYKLISGIDFYNFVQKHLEQYSTIDFLQGKITAINSTSNQATAQIEGKTYTANFLFNSSFRPEPDKTDRYTYWLQHFLGWQIETDEAIFTPKEATLMDFRIEQQGETRFVYVLPFSERSALVEFTVFSPQLLPQSTYKAVLKAYCRDFLHLKNYRISHTEFGVIPMTDQPFPVQTGQRIVHIGTAGGQTKPSTGYTFSNIQQQSKAIVQALQQTGQPFYPKSYKKQRFKVYDSTLLRVLNEGNYSGKQIFTDLFQKNPAPKLLQFLDDDTKLLDELRIFNTVPIPTFIKAMGKSVWRDLG